MKKKVKQYVQQTQNGGRNHEQVLKEFSRMLDDQVKQSRVADVFLVPPMSIHFSLQTIHVHLSFFVAD